MADFDPLPVDLSKFVPEGGERPTEFPDAAPAAGFCSNQSFGGPFIPERPETEVPPTKAALDLSKRWRDGAKLQVVFLNGTDVWGATIRQAVRNLAPTWSDYANVTFDFDQPTAHVTINLLPQPGVPIGTYNCWMGVDCLQAVRQGRQSMNLVFNPALANDPNRLQEEFRRVILHEFGHCLGFIHEHMRPDGPIVWDEAALNRTFGVPPNSWTPQMIRQQIVDAYRGGPLSSSAFDLKSIMMYQFPPGLARYEDGRAFDTPNNTVLTPMDKVMANVAYPAEGAGELAEALLKVDGPSKAGEIAEPGQVARYRFTIDTPGVHVVKTEGATPLLLSIQRERDEADGRLFAVEGTNLAQPVRFTEARDYYVAVRHAKPMRGVGAFKVSVERA